MIPSQAFQQQFSPCSMNNIHEQSHRRSRPAGWGGSRTYHTGVNDESRYSCYLLRLTPVYEENRNNEYKMVDLCNRLFLNHANRENNKNNIYTKFRDDDHTKSVVLQLDDNTTTNTKSIILGRKELCELWWKNCPNACNAHIPSSSTNNGDRTTTTSSTTSFHKRRICEEFCTNVRRKTHLQSLSRKILIIHQRGTSSNHYSNNSNHFQQRHIESSGSGLFSMSIHPECKFPSLVHFVNSNANNNDKIHDDYKSRFNSNHKQAMLVLIGEDPANPWMSFILEECSYNDEQHRRVKTNYTGHIFLVTPSSTINSHNVIGNQTITANSSNSMVTPKHRHTQHKQLQRQEECSHQSSETSNWIRVKTGSTRLSDHTSFRKRRRELRRRIFDDADSSTSFEERSDDEQKINGHLPPFNCFLSAMNDDSFSDESYDFVKRRYKKREQRMDKEETATSVRRQSKKRRKAEPLGISDCSTVQNCTDEVQSIRNKDSKNCNFSWLDREEDNDTSLERSLQLQEREVVLKTKLMPRNLRFDDSCGQETKQSFVRRKNPSMASENCASHKKESQVENDNISFNSIKVNDLTIRHIKGMNPSSALNTDHSDRSLKMSFENVSDLDVNKEGSCLSSSSHTTENCNLPLLTQVLECATRNSIDGISDAVQKLETTSNRELRSRVTNCTHQTRSVITLVDRVAKEKQSIELKETMVKSNRGLVDLKVPNQLENSVDMINNKNSQKMDSVPQMLNNSKTNILSCPVYKETSRSSELSHYGAIPRPQRKATDIPSSLLKCQSTLTSKTSSTSSCKQSSSVSPILFLNSTQDPVSCTSSTLATFQEERKQLDQNGLLDSRTNLKIKASPKAPIDDKLMQKEAIGPLESIDLSISNNDNNDGRGHVIKGIAQAENAVVQPKALVKYDNVHVIAKRSEKFLRSEIQKAIPGTCSTGCEKQAPVDKPNSDAYETINKLANDIAIDLPGKQNMVDGQNYVDFISTPNLEENAVSSARSNRTKKGLPQICSTCTLDAPCQSSEIGSAYLSLPLPESMDGECDYSLDDICLKREDARSMGTTGSTEVCKLQNCHEQTIERWLRAKQKETERERDSKNSKSIFRSAMIDLIVMKNHANHQPRSELWLPPLLTNETRFLDTDSVPDL